MLYTEDGFFSANATFATIRMLLFAMQKISIDGA